MAVSYGVKKIEIASPNDGKGENGLEFKTIYVDECDSAPLKDWSNPAEPSTDAKEMIDRVTKEENKRALVRRRFGWSVMPFLHGVDEVFKIEGARNEP